MIKNFFFFFAVIFFFSGCSKTSDNGCGFTDTAATAPASEIATLQAYVAANNPAAVQHASGIFYDITMPGSGARPTVCSTITVKYSGYLTNGYKFDENLTGTTFTLGQLILGWQKGLPLIPKGGSITLYIPPSLGYGGTAQASIPANSILIFNIQLIDVQ